MSQLDQRLEHAQHEFNYYSQDLKALNCPAPLRSALNVAANVLAAPFAARAFLINDGMYRTAIKSDGTLAYTPPEAKPAPKGPQAAP